MIVAASCKLSAPCRPQFPSGLRPVLMLYNDMLRQQYCQSSQQSLSLTRLKQKSHLIVSSLTRCCCVVSQSEILGVGGGKYIEYLDTRLRRISTLSEPLPSCRVSVEPHGTPHMVSATAVLAYCMTIDSQTRPIDSSTGLWEGSESSMQAIFAAPRRTAHLSDNSSINQMETE